MNGRSVPPPPSWPNLALIAGGLLMVPMWARYTTLHGPTSVGEGGHWLGQGPGFWGSMMAPATLLIVLGLYGNRTVLAGRGGRLAGIGYGLWAMGYGLWAMGYGLWAMGYGLWAHHDRAGRPGRG